jgi:hypothetical protein
VRPIIRAALGLGAVTILIGFGFWLTAGVSGEVFLLSPDGRPESAPGAQVRIYRSDDKHSFEAFLGPMYQALRNSMQKCQNYPAPVGAHEDFYKFSRSICQISTYKDVEFEVSKYWQTFATKTTTDRSGKFSARLAPGKYVILVSGQAGRSQAQWLTDVQVIWRSESRLSKPIYAYEPE